VGYLATDALPEAQLWIRVSGHHRKHLSVLAPSPLSLAGERGTEAYRVFDVRPNTL